MAGLLWQCLDRHLWIQPKFQDLWKHLGHDFDSSHIGLELSLVAADLAEMFGCGAKPCEGLWSSLLVKLVKCSGDPDEPAACWPELGTPLGIVEPIPFGGVFPRIAPDQVLSEGKRLQSVQGLIGADHNYKSYDEERLLAEELFSKELHKGYVDFSLDREVLEAKYGPLVPSAMGLIVKTKADGSKKGRLVHDLRRSDVNSHIVFEERLVLPRLRDAVEDVLSLMESASPEEQILLMSADFADAFKQLPAMHREKRYLSGKALGGFFVYHKILFGVRTGPLVWGRVAALISRCTQALFEDQRCRLQTYVDDPLLACRGKLDTLVDIQNKVLLLWSVLGLKIAWPKGSTGTSVEWIGAKLEVNNDNKSLQISVTPEKVDEWKLLVAQLSKKPLVSRKVLMRFTGKMSWAAGFIPQLKPFVRMLYAALSVKGNNADPDTVYQRQVDPAVSWISQFLHGLRGGISRTISAFKRHECQLDFYVDASPWGGGAVKLDETGRPLMTFALAWTPQDESLVGAKIGDPGSQALWEAYMMLKCVWQWLEPNRQGFIRIRGDAQGVLASLVKRSAHSPLLNKVVREMALYLARHFVALEALHVWSENNTWADQLSRGIWPSELAGLPTVDAPRHYWQS